MARASIRPRSGGYEVRVPYRDADGKRHCKSEQVNPAQGETMRECRARADEIAAETERQVHLGLDPADARMTLRQFVEQEYLPVAELKLRHRTLRGYRSNLRLYVLPSLGQVEIRKLTPPMIQKFYGRLTVKGLGPLSVRQVHAVLRRLLNLAVRWNMIIRNPADAVELPRLTHYEPQVLDEEGARALLQAAEGGRLRVPIALGLGAGLRTEEVLGLTWSAVDLERAVIRITRTVQREKGKGLTAEDAKTHRSRRPVDLPPALVAVLRAWRREQAAERLRAGPAWQGGDWVCAREDGSLLPPEQLTRGFGALLDAAGLPPMRFYDLRHSSASLLLAEGVHAKIISERLGHSQIGITMDLYSHLLPGVGKEAAGKLDGIFRRGDVSKL